MINISKTHTKASFNFAMYSLDEILDLELLESSISKFSNLVSLPITLINTEGEVLISKGFTDLCSFHQKDKKTSQICKDHILEISNNIADNNKIKFKCPLGLYNYAIPLIIENKHMATIILGQVLLKEDSDKEDYFIKQAKNNNFNIENYIKLFKKNPIVDNEKMEQIIHYYISQIEIIANIGISSLQQKLNTDSLKIAEETLFESKKNLETTLNSIGDGVIVTDKNYCIKRMNPIAEELCGYDFDNVKGTHISKVFKIKDFESDSFDDIISSYSNKENDKLFFKKLYSNKKKQYYISYNASSIYDENNNLNGIVLVFSDKTENHEITENLRKSEEKHRTILNSMMDGVYICNSKFDITYTNPAMNIIMGEEIKGQKCYSAIHANESKCAKCPMDRVLSGKIVEGESFNSKTGKIFEVSNSPYFLDGIASKLTVVRDITQQKKIEKQLKESEERYKSLFDTAPSGILVANISSKKIQFANSSAYKLFGYNYSEFSKMHISNIHPEKDHKWIFATFDSQAKSEFSIANRIPCMKKNGDIFYSDITTKKTIIDGIECNIGFFVDTTEKDKAEKLRIKSKEDTAKLHHEKLRAQLAEESNLLLKKEVSTRKKAEEKLKKSLVEKEILLKEVHHRVKNNMQIISSMLNLQRSKFNNPEINNAFIESQDRIKSMALVHENLYRSKNLNEVNFNEYISTLARTLYHNYNVSSEIVQLKIEMDDIKLPLDYSIPCGLIMNELISNSLKYAFKGIEKDGIIFITIKNSIDNKIKIIIGDNGIGMNYKLEDFDNLPSLGLQLVDALTNQIDGKLTLDTTNGTEYSIEFLIES